MITPERVGREFRIWAETTNVDATMRGAFTAGFAAGMTEVLSKSPLQAAALAALVAWRESLKTSRKAGSVGDPWFVFLRIERELVAAADALIASLEVTT